MNVEFEKRMKKLDETVKPLDNLCSYILAHLSVKYPREKGFNEMLRELRKGTYKRARAELSRTTLSKHLEHLREKGLIVLHVLEDSPLKFKPTKYMLSPYFAEIVRDAYEYKLLDPMSALPEMRREQIKPLTIFLMDILLGNVFEFMKNAIKYPEKIAAYQRHVIYFHFDNVVRAFRMRVLEKYEKEKALKAIDDFGDYWREVRNEKWGALIATMHSYKYTQDERKG